MESLQIPEKPNSEPKPQLHTRAEQMSKRRRAKRLGKVFLAVSSVLTVAFSISMGVGVAALCAGLIVSDKVLVQAYLENPIEAIFQGFAVAAGSAITAPVVLSQIARVSLTVAVSLLVCIVVIAIVKRVLKI